MKLYLGRRDAAIRVSIKPDALVQCVTDAGHQAGFGNITYAGQTSMVQPQFLGGLTHEQEDLFFHKHRFYDWESEFRVVVFKSGPLSIPLNRGLIERITISPFGSLDPDVERCLRKKFPQRVHVSKLVTPYSA